MLMSECTGRISLGFNSGGLGNSRITALSMAVIDRIRYFRTCSSVMQKAIATEAKICMPCFLELPCVLTQRLLTFDAGVQPDCSIIQVMVL
jgi:hypothetical protein